MHSPTLLVTVLLPLLVPQDSQRQGRLLLTNGDYVHPTFSPSGRFLAISEVIADSARENTQVLIYDFEHARLDTILPVRAAEKYATYKAYVSGFSWLGDTALVATIPDGDVSATGVTLSVTARRVIGEEQLDADIGVTPPLADSLGELYPNIVPPGRSASDVFASAVRVGVIRGPAVVVLQKNYVGHDDDVWLFRLDRPEATRLLRTPTSRRETLVGGFTTGSDIVFAIGAERLALVRLRGGAVDTLATVAGSAARSGLSVRAVQGDSAWFIVKVHASYEQGRNPAFFYDGSRLAPVGPNLELYDFDVHPQSRRVALAYWSGGQRHITVDHPTVK